MAKYEEEDRKVYSGVCDLLSNQARSPKAL